MTALPASEPTALLVELFTEELPPKALRKLGDAFADAIVAELVARALAPRDARVDRFATPRRLAVRVAGVAAQAADRNVEAKGPSLQVGLDASGQATEALKKWAARQGVEIAALRQGHDGKQAVFYADRRVTGDRLDDVIEAIIVGALAKLPIPKVMQYQLADGVTTVSFVRPAHSLIVLHGARVVTAAVLGLQSGRDTRGHRFQSEGTLSIVDAGAYESTLEQSGRVIASFDARRERIAHSLASHAQALDASLGPADAVTPLLDEVTALVEWPAVYVGRFDREFLQVPQECLILTMRTNQKYFPLFDAAGQLRAEFLIVSNLAVDDPRLIIEGNERVVRPRLADARFFFDQDRKVRLDSRLPELAKVVYHAKLGSQAQRSERVAALAVWVAALMGEDPEIAQRAAQLAKADLLTGMVGEFPELQGIMGRYYAGHDGEAPAIADAMAEQYQPRFSGDALPASPIGTSLALADKMETLAGLFAIGQVPTGDKDPFALRRHALGIVRMLVEKQLPLALDALIAKALGVLTAAGFAASPQASTQLGDFFRDRLSSYLRERGYSHHEIAAVLSRALADPATLLQRLDAVRAFQALPQAQALAAANKRIGNILSKARAKSAAGAGAGAPAETLQPAAVDPQLLSDGAERALAQRVAALTPQVDAQMEAGHYEAALQLLAQARDDVDAFFEGVMVMAEDPAVRGNRLALLGQLQSMMNRVADLSKLE